jgi:adenine-specific DNA-methyltransferase
MTRVFIGGSRRLGRLSEDVKRRLDRIVDKKLTVLIGDANGADRAVQEYLSRKGHRLVEVFCTGVSCRNNVSGWPVRQVRAATKKRDFEFYATKDRAMAEEATVGLMLWDGSSVGTLMNIARLVRRGKKVVVYLGPEARFVDVRDSHDWEALRVACHADVRAALDRREAEEDAGDSTQTSLL